MSSNINVSYIFIERIKFAFTFKSYNHIKTYLSRLVKCSAIIHIKLFIWCVSWTAACCCSGSSVINKGCGPGSLWSATTADCLPSTADLLTSTADVAADNWPLEVNGVLLLLMTISRSAPSPISISLIFGFWLAWSLSKPLKVSALLGNEGEAYTVECFSPADDTDLDKFVTEE